MSKKILSIVLALTFALSCFAVSAFAIGELGYEDEDSTYYQKWSLSEAAEDASGNWYVEVSLEADYKVGAMQFELEFSSADITIADVVAGDGLTDDYNADIAFDTTGASNIVAIIPNPVEDADEAIDASAGIVVCRVYFTVADSASGTVQIVDDAKSKTNPGGTLFAARMSDGILATGASIIGQDTTIETPARNIGAVSLPAELVLTATGTSKGVVIDNTHTFGGAYAGVVYGITAATYKTKANITNNVEASNGGSLVVKASDGKTNASGNYGTGSTIEVLNADGTSTGKVYVFVVFGDVDGNGLINGNDVKGVQKAVTASTTYANNSVQRMAANCQNVVAAAKMHTINGNDVKVVQANVSGTKMNQGALATRMSGNATYYK
jgi:hypothetical protein